MANKTIHELSPATTVGSGYEFAVYDTDNNTTKKATAEQVLSTSDLLYADDDINIPDTDVEFTSADNTLNPASTTAIESIALFGESDTWSNRLGKISQLFKNVRIIFSKLGTTNISSINDGTITGAINMFNGWTALTITSGSNITIDPMSKAYLVGGKYIYLAVKGYSTAAINNAGIFTFSGDKNIITPGSFPIGVGGQWGITGVAYGYASAKAITSTLASGTWFHVNIMFPVA